jgi:hypothetical protein
VEKGVYAYFIYVKISEGAKFIKGDDYEFKALKDDGDQKS